MGKGRKDMLVTGLNLKNRNRRNDKKEKEFKKR
jgi:hypothetical protein